MPAGLLRRVERPEYAHRLRQEAARRPGEPGLRPAPISPLFASRLDREFRLVVAGSAGGRVRSAARTLGEAALLSGLWASQSDEYPVTVQTGHSISEVILSPNEILYTGIPQPDALILVSEDGRQQSERYLAGLKPASWLFVPEEFAGIETPARKVVVDFGAAGLRSNKKNSGLLMTAASLRILGLFPFEACGEAVRRSQRGAIAEEHLAALEQSGLLAARATPPD
jgi:Pyruvate/2-oxoacid:ferredoxin oxidoreductase gamma subunit